MMTKMGRPGEGRAKRGRLRGAVRPDLKAKAEQIARSDFRFGRSLSRFTEAALTYYIAQYEAANGKIDNNGFPILE